MPCEVWNILADREKSNRIEAGMLSSPGALGMAQSRRTKMIKEYWSTADEARHQMDGHRQSCPVCSQEPAQSFHDPDPWDDKKL